MIPVDIALAALALTFLAGLVRVVLGPTVADRAIAADLCFFAAVGAVALLPIRQGSTAYVDVVLVATLLGFIATISLARLIGRRER